MTFIWINTAAATAKLVNFLNMCNPDKNLGLAVFRHFFFKTD